MTTRRRGAGWIEIAPPTRRSRIGIAEPWADRELVLFLVERDLKIRYKQTALGVLWALVQPITTVVLFTVIFGNLAGLPSDGMPYAVFAIVGVAVWQYFVTAVAAASNSLVGHAELVNKVYFPRVLAPVASAISPLVDLVIALVLAAGAMLIYGVEPGLQLTLLPVFMLSTALVAVAVGLWLSALNVAYRDVRHATPFLLQAWLYASPVVFPSSLIPERWQPLYALNPMVGVIDGTRWSLAGGPGLEPFHLMSLLSALVIGLSGLRYFRGSERTFADII